MSRQPLSKTRCGCCASRVSPHASRHWASIAAETRALMQAMVSNGEIDALVPERVWREMERALGESTSRGLSDVLAWLRRPAGRCCPSCAGERTPRGFARGALSLRTMQVRFAALVAGSGLAGDRIAVRAPARASQYRELALLCRAAAAAPRQRRRHWTPPICLICSRSRRAAAAGALRKAAAGVVRRPRWRLDQRDELLRSPAGSSRRPRRHAESARRALAGPEIAAALRAARIEAGSGLGQQLTACAADPDRRSRAVALVEVARQRHDFEVSPISSGSSSCRACDARRARSSVVARGRDVRLRCHWRAGRRPAYSSRRPQLRVDAGLGHAGEIHPGGDVLQARIQQRILVRAMAKMAAQRAAISLRVVVLVAWQTIIDEQQRSATRVTARCCRSTARASDRARSCSHPASRAAPAAPAPRATHRPRAGRHR